MPPETKHLQFENFSLDVAGRQLRRDAEPVSLSGKALELLIYMASNPGRPVLKNELLSALWPESFVEESNLSQNVFLVRKALGPQAGSIIQTLPGRGYQFTAAVSDFSPTVRAALQEASRTGTLQTTSTRIIYQEETEEHLPFWRSPALLGSIALSAVFLCVAGWLGWQRWQDHVGGPPVQVVMADMDGGTGDAVLDRTLSGVLRIELAQSPFVTVISGAIVQQTLAQMMRQPGDALTVQLAREVCERTASQAVLRGSVARAGSGYLLTEEAVNCLDGATLAASTENVAKAEDFPSAIRDAAATLRRGLGESRRTIARFNAPLAPVGTGSLEALKDFTQASTLASRGHFPEAIELLKQAVTLDPKFSGAYLNLCIFSLNSLDNDGAKTYIQKAYDARDYGTEPTKLFIGAMYHTLVTQDLFESRRSYQAWVEMYPRSPQAWSGIENVDMNLGQLKDALVAVRHAQELLPANFSALQGIATLEEKTGDFAGARATIEAAMSHGLDGEGFRFILLRIGHLQHDAALIDAQEAWLKEHPDSPILLANMAQYALDEGRIAEAERLFERVSAAFSRRGQPAAALSILQQSAESYAAIEEPEKARRLLHLGPVEAELSNMLALVDLGDPAAANALLQKELTAHPQSTLLTLRYAPLVRGDIAMVAGKPQDAIAAMEPSRQLDGQGMDGFYLRGKAYMQARQYPQAEGEFRALIAHTEREPTAYQVPLAQLQLGRVLALEGDRVSALAAYRVFLSNWAHADTASPLLKQAQIEYETLQKNV